MFPNKSLQNKFIFFYWRHKLILLFFLYFLYIMLMNLFLHVFIILSCFFIFNRFITGINFLHFYSHPFFSFQTKYIVLYLSSGVSLIIYLFSTTPVFLKIHIVILFSISYDIPNEQLFLYYLLWHRYFITCYSFDKFILL